MTAFVLDASAVIAWIVPGQQTDEASRLLDIADTSTLSAPFLFPAEVRNALLKLERQGRCLGARADEGLDLLDSLEIDLERPPTSLQSQRLLATARLENLSFYDVQYLDLAQKAGTTLATRDTALLRAAERRGVRSWDLR